MSEIFYVNLEEIRRYFEQIKNLLEEGREQMPKPKTLDDIIVGLVAYASQEESLVFTPLESLLKEQLSYEKLKLLRKVEERLYDISIIPDRRLAVLANCPEYYVSILNSEGKLIRKFEENYYVNRVFYDGNKYIYHTGGYGIRRINLDTLTEETIISKDNLEMLNRKGNIISWLQFRDRKWYILVKNKDSTYTLYSTNNLNDTENWKEEIYWNIVHDSFIISYIISFDFLPDGSIISTVPLEYLDINGRQNLEVSGESKYIYRLRVLPLNKKKAYVFYAGIEFIGYALLRKEKEWKVIKSKYIRDIGRPIELVMGEDYEKVIKSLIQ